MHFPVIGESLGWRTTDFEELYGDLGQWSMTKELAREVSGFYLSSPCEVWWLAESVLNMSRSRADRTMSSWLLYFRNFTNFFTVSHIIWTPLWTKCTSAAAILSNISADEKRKIEQLQAFKTRLGMCDIMSNYMLAQSLVLILTQYEIKNLGNSETCRQNIKVCDALWPEVTNLHDANQL